MEHHLLDEIFTNNATDDECLRAALEQWLQIHPVCKDLSDALQKIGEGQNYCTPHVSYIHCLDYFLRTNEEFVS